MECLKLPNSFDPNGPAYTRAIPRGPMKIERRHKSAFTLIEMLVSISVIALLSALLLPAVQSAREAARRMKCSSNFASVGIAVQNYVASHSHFPPGNISWNGGWKDCDPCVHLRYSMFSRILPYLEQSSLFDALNFDVSVSEPADPASDWGYPLELANLTVRLVTLDVLLCPSDTTPQSRWSAGTNVRSNNGSLPNTYAYDNARLGGPAGVITVYDDGTNHARHTTSLASVTDGLSNTVLASEKLRGSEAAATFDPRRHYLIYREIETYTISSDRFKSHCLAPDAKYEGFEPRSGLAWILGEATHSTYNHVSGINMAHGDCFSPGGGGTLVMSSARSQHPGGVNVGMADGSVRFVKNGISLEVWRALGSKAGGEPISNLEY